MPDVTISPKGEDRIRSGHPWVYRSDLVEVSAERGEIVMVKGRRKATVGYALYSDRSEIALRLLTRGHDAPSLDDRGVHGWMPPLPIASPWPSMRLPTGWSTAKRIACRGSSSIATATTSCCRPSCRASIACCRT